MGIRTRLVVVSVLAVALGSGVACGIAPPSSERLERVSEALNSCTPACTTAWTDCVATNVCGFCGGQGMAPCDTTGPDPGCVAQASLSDGGSPPRMGALNGVCEPCGDLNEPACDPTWQPPGNTTWIAGCDPGSVSSPGQALQASGGTCIGCGLPGQPSCSCPTSTAGCVASAAVTVVPGTEAGVIGPSFIGLSYDTGKLNESLLTPANAPLVALLKLLGPGVLRIGGGGYNGVDANSWLTDGGAGARESGQIGEGNIGALGVDGNPGTGLAGFLQATGWTAIYALPMLANCSDGSEPGTAPLGGTANGCVAVTPSAVVAEAQTVAGALGPYLAGFELGNEPDIYAKLQEGNLLDYVDFVLTWQSIYTDIHNVLPGVPFSGPGPSAVVSALVPGKGIPTGTSSADEVAIYEEMFAQQESTNINLLTQHYYRDFVPPGALDCEVGEITADGGVASCDSYLLELLNPDPVLIPALKELDSLAATNDIAHGYRISEANSLSGGGLAGVSDSQGAALWMVDFLFTNAMYGSVGVNIYGNGEGDSYQPIADNTYGQVCDTGDAGPCWLSVDKGNTPQRAADPAVRPDYYGMLLFALAGQGNVVGTQYSSSLNLTAYAVELPNGTTSVVIVNKDAARTASASVNVAKTITNGSLTLLTGPGLTATSAVTLGGDVIPPNPDAGWIPPTTPVSVSGSTFSVDVPPASAALVQTSCTVACRAGQCGEISTVCGTVNCGGCTGVLTCGGSGVPNECGRPLICPRGSGDCGGYCCRCGGGTNCM
jgi:hypothetical protein